MIYLIYNAHADETPHKYGLGYRLGLDLSQKSQAHFLESNPFPNIQPIEKQKYVQN